MQHKLAAGQSFPTINVTTREGATVQLGKPRRDTGTDW